MIFLTSKLKVSLKARLLFSVWLVSSLATFIFTTFQLVTEYRTEQERAFDQINIIRTNYLPSISKSVWDYNENYLELQMNSLKNLPYISFISISSDNRKIYEFTNPNDNLMITEFPLVYENGNIGNMSVGLNIAGIRSNYIVKAIKIFFAQAVKTLFVCFLLLKIFDHLIMRHLLKMSNYLKNFELNDGKRLDLKRDSDINDELSLVINSLNQLKGEISLANQRLSAFNKELEEKVEERTTLLDIERAKGIHAAKYAAIGEMAGGIAHEINNPLAIILLNAKYISKLIELDKLKTEDLKTAVAKINETLLRISKIINGLRTVSRNSGVFQKEQTNLSDILQDVLGLCSERFKNNGIMIKINPDLENLKHNIFCDRIQLSQVLLNLLGNSFDAIEKNKERWVEIKHEVQGQFNILRITDSGNGIPPEIVEKMFNPFFTSKEIGKGTGLGLSISKGIMETHGGSIEMDNSSSNTSFILRIPVEA